MAPLTPFLISACNARVLAEYRRLPWPTGALTDIPEPDLTTLLPNAQELSIPGGQGKKELSLFPAQSITTYTCLPALYKHCQR